MFISLFFFSPYLGVVSTSTDAVVSQRSVHTILTLWVPAALGMRGLVWHGCFIAYYDNHTTPARYLWPTNLKPLICTTRLQSTRWLQTPLQNPCEAINQLHALTVMRIDLCRVVFTYWKMYITVQYVTLSNNRTRLYFLFSSNYGAQVQIYFGHLLLVLYSDGC